MANHTCPPGVSQCGGKRKTRRNRKSRKPSRKVARKASRKARKSRKKRGGMAAAIERAVVPFGLLALQKKMQKRSRKSRR
jgi:hypothetical protein|tara:strand:- start:2665 stop:2904 length:240 start_codon:yes stop_codon:yes gene_type:complete